MLQHEQIRTIVQGAIQDALEHAGRPRRSYEDDDVLVNELGLDSLDLAYVVVLLEQQLGIDPFRKPGVSIRTFGDLVKAYRATAKTES